MGCARLQLVTLSDRHLDEPCLLTLLSSITVRSSYPQQYQHQEDFMMMMMMKISQQLNS
jgi:hypothetical protein